MTLKNTMNLVRTLLVAGCVAIAVFMLFPGRAACSLAVAASDGHLSLGDLLADGANADVVTSASSTSLGDSSPDRLFEARKPVVKTTSKKKVKTTSRKKTTTTKRKATTKRKITTKAGTVAKIAVSPTKLVMARGETRQLTAVAKDAQNNVVTGKPVTWRSSDPSRVSVNAQGLVRMLPKSQQAAHRLLARDLPPVVVSASVDSLVANASVALAMRVSGLVTTSDGPPCGDCDVQAFSGGVYSNQATTNANGSYSLYLVPGNYSFRLNYRNGKFTGSPKLSFELAVFDNVEQNIVVPMSIWSGTVQDLDGTPVAGAVLSAQLLDLTGYFTNVQTGINGQFSVKVLPGTYFWVKVAKPPGSVYLDTAFPNQNLTSDLTATYTIDRGGTALRGVVKTANGAIAVGSQVYARKPGFELQDTTDAQGKYSFDLANGSYTVVVWYKTESYFASPKTTWPAVVSGDTILDITLPTVSWSGRVIDSNNNGVAGVTFSANVMDLGGWFSIKSGANGVFSFQAFPALYSFVRLTPPAGTTSFVVTALADITLNSTLAGVEYTIEKPDKELSGIVRGSDNQPINGTEVIARRADGFEARNFTNAQGRYSLAVLAGSYTLSFHYINSVFQGFPKTTYPVTVSNAPVTTQNAQLPTAIWSGQVKNGQGNGVAGVTFTGSSTDVSGWFTVVTGANGVFSFVVLTAKYTFVRLEPPAGSNYVSTPLADENVTGDQTGKVYTIYSQS